MVWDLGRAMRKKEEFESARLMDFEFRQRARAMRRLAQRLGRDERSLARATADQPDEAILRDLAGDTGRDEEEIIRLYHACLIDARAELIAERGDPTPYRLG